MGTWNEDNFHLEEKFNKRSTSAFDLWRWRKHFFYLGMVAEVQGRGAMEGRKFN